jgi:hypothetical protein
LQFSYSTGNEQEIDAKGTVSAGRHGNSAAWFTLTLDASRVAALQQAVRVKHPGRRAWPSIIGLN